VDHQPDQVSTVVIRTRDPELLVAAAAAARLAMATWPSGTVATTLYADQVDGDAEHAAVLDSAFQQYITYNPPGVGEPTRQIVRTLLSNIVSQQEQTPPLPQPDPLTDAQRLVPGNHRCGRGRGGPAGECIAPPNTGVTTDDTRTRGTRLGGLRGRSCDNTARSHNIDNTDDDSIIRINEWNNNESTASVSKTNSHDGHTSPLWRRPRWRSLACHGRSYHRARCYENWRPAKGC